MPDSKNEKCEKATGEENHDPIEGMKVTQDFLSEVAGERKKTQALEIPEGFDSAIHKADENGNPILGSKKQFLLKKEAKKTARQKIHEGISNLLGKKEFPEKSNIPGAIPLSDHELQKKEETDNKRRAELSTREADLTASSESSAELFFFGGSMVLGLDFVNQRDGYFDKVAAHFRRYEERTGRTVDLPPSLGLCMGLSQVAYAIAQREPQCKGRLDAGMEVVRSNVGEYLGDKVPLLGMFGKKREIPAEIPTEPTISEGNIHD